MGWVDGHHDNYEYSYEDWIRYRPYNDEPFTQYETFAGFACYKASETYEECANADNDEKPNTYDEANEMMSFFTELIIDNEMENKQLYFIDVNKVKPEAHRIINDVSPSSLDF